MAGARAPAVFARRLVLVFGTLVPMIGLVQAGSQARADRFTYIAQIGLFWRLSGWSSVARARGMAIAAAGVLLRWLYSLPARSRSGMIASRSSSIPSALPGPRARRSLMGTACANLGDNTARFPVSKFTPSEAGQGRDLERFRRHPHAPDRDPDAAKAFGQALALDPDSTTARYNLARTLARLGRRDDL